MFQNQRNYAKVCSFEERAEYEEAKNLLRSVSCVLNKLVKKQIDEKLCERLPSHLKSFLKRIVRPPKHRISQRHDDRYHEDTFLFRASCPPAKLDPDVRSQLEVNLVKLLDRYNQLDEDSRKRAAPLKSYITTHLDMLKKIDDDFDTDTPGMGSDNFMESNDMPQMHTRSNSDEMKMDNSPNSRASFSNLDTMEKDLENLDLDKKRSSYQQPTYNLNNFNPVKIAPEGNLMENKHKKRNVDDSNDFLEKNNNLDKDEMDDALTSNKYKKLVKAAEEVRFKRRNDEKIGEVFGNKKLDDNDPDAKEQDDQVAFETPLVYSP